jgi:hypothetical protein
MLSYELKLIIYHLSRKKKNKLNHLINTNKSNTKNYIFITQLFDTANLPISTYHNIYINEG